MLCFVLVPVSYFALRLPLYLKRFLLFCACIHCFAKAAAEMRERRNAIRQLYGVDPDCLLLPNNHNITFLNDQPPLSLLSPAASPSPPSSTHSAHSSSSVFPSSWYRPIFGLRSLASNTLHHGSNHGALTPEDVAGADETTIDIDTILKKV